MDETFWDKVVSKGRIAEWIISGGGIALCITGGIMGFLDGASISTIILAMVAAVFGIESLSK